MQKTNTDVPKKLKLDCLVFCPVCDAPRNKGNHRKCSKITRLKHIKERGELA